MAVVGTKLDNFDMPICTKFRPTILKGQLCYQVDVNEYKSQVDKQMLISHGLVLLLDYNEDKMGPDGKDDFKVATAKDLSHMQKNNDETQDALIYVETLGMQSITMLDSLTVLLLLNCYNKSDLKKMINAFKQRASFTFWRRKLCSY